MKSKILYFLRFGISLIVASLILYNCDVIDNNENVSSTCFVSRIGTNDWDFGASIVQTPDYSYFLAGYSYTTSQFNHYSWLSKLNAQGKEEWKRLYEYSYCSDMILSSESELVALFNNNDEIQFVKLNFNGDVLFTKRLKVLSFSSREGGSLIQSIDGNFIISGWSDSSGSAQGPFYGFISKINSGGDTLWNYISPKCIISTTAEDINGNYYAAGTYIDKDINFFASMVVKINSEGKLIWKKIFNENQSYGFASVKIKKPETILTCGRESLNLLSLENIDQNGNIIWKTNYLGNNYYAEGNSVVVDNKGRIIVLGTIMRENNSKTLLLHYDENGILLTEKEFEGEYSGRLNLTFDNGLIFFTQSNLDTNYYARDVLVYKLNP